MKRIRSNAQRVLGKGEMCCRVWGTQCKNKENEMVGDGREKKKRKTRIDLLYGDNPKTAVYVQNDLHQK